MWRRSAVVLAVLAMVVTAGLWVRLVMSEDAPAPMAAPAPGAPGAATAPGAPGGPGTGLDRFRQALTDRLKEILGATDEEWKVLQPRVEKVMTLTMQSRFGGLNIGALVGRGRRGGPGGPGPDTTAPQTEIDKTGAALQNLLDNKDAKSEEIKAALAALREMRAKAGDELEKARKSLREVLTLRQEAQLVMMGLLD